MADWIIGCLTGSVALLMDELMTDGLVGWFVGLLHALNDSHNPFFHTQAPRGPPQDLSWHTTEGFLEVDEDKIEPFVGSSAMLTDCISETCSMFPR